MKALVCEMCGSNKLLKQDGMYVCQACGTQYSPEEAKKLLVEIEGTVDVTGSTVKVDNTDKIGNFLQMATKAYDAGNKSESENYCNKIIEIDPKHYQAWLLKGKSAGWQSTLRNIRIEEAINCFCNAIDNAPQEEVATIRKEAADEVSSLSESLVRLCCNNFAEYPSKDNEEDILNNLRLTSLLAIKMFNKANIIPKNRFDKLATAMNDAVCDAWKNVITEDYQHSEHPSKICWETFKGRCLSCIYILNKAIDIAENKKDNIQRYKNLIHITTELVQSCSYDYNGYPEWRLTDEAKKLHWDNIMEHHNKIKELDPNYVIPPRPTPKAKSGGCYVATCVYGSYNCPEVWTLRRYRDDTLGSTWYGRTFIRIYYAISPTLVKWFGHTAWFKKMWKGKLDKMVKNLQEKGVENTPYDDKDWRK